MKFISIEGIDGAGKTSLCHNLVERLRAEGYRTTFISKKDKLDIDELYNYRQDLLQELIWGKSNANSDFISSYHRFLTIAALYTLISPAIADKCKREEWGLVLTDGWFYRHLIKTALRTNRTVHFYNTIMQEVLVPDIVLQLEIDPKEVWERRADWSDHEVGLWDGFQRDRKNGFIQYQRKIQQAFEVFSAEPNWQLIQLKGTDDQNKVCELAFDILKKTIS